VTEQKKHPGDQCSKGANKHLDVATGIETCRIMNGSYSMYTSGSHDAFGSNGYTGVRRVRQFHHIDGSHLARTAPLYEQRKNYRGYR
jgi:hypothetical protein